MTDCVHLKIKGFKVYRNQKGVRNVILVEFKARFTNSNK